MLKKRIIIVLSIIMILANFLPLNICLATTTVQTPVPTSTSINSNDLDNLIYDGLGKRTNNATYKLV